MKKLTATSLALTLTLSLGATSAMASSFEDKDMAIAFGSEGTMEVATLSDQEMADTVGAWGPWGAVAGGALGGIQYLGYAAGSGSFSLSSFGYNVGGGAAMGAVGGPMGIGTFLASRPVAFGVGFVGGYNRW